MSAYILLGLCCIIIGLVLGVETVAHILKHDKIFRAFIIRVLMDIQKAESIKVENK